MTPGAAETAHEHLLVCLLRIEAFLADPADADGRGAVLGQQARQIESGPGAGALPLVRLGERFHLTAFERDALLLAAAPVLLPRLARRLAGTRATPEGGPASLAPTVAEILDALAPAPDDHLIGLTAFGGTGKLVAAGLVQGSAGGPPGPSDTLHVPEHWLGFLQGRRELGSRAARFAERIVPAVSLEQVVLAETARRNLAWIVGRLASAAPFDEPLLEPEGLGLPRGAAVVLHGAPGSGRSLLARALATTNRRALLVVDGTALGYAADAAPILRTLVEQAQLFEEILLVRGADRLLERAPQAGPVLRAELTARRALALLTCSDVDPVDEALEPVIACRQELPALGPRERRQAWQLNLPEALSAGPDVDFDRLADMPLTGGQIAGAVGLALRLARPLPDQPDAEAARTPCEANHAMLAVCAEHQLRAAANTAKTTSTGFSLRDLVLPDDTRQQLEEVLQAAKFRDRVLTEWGFSEVVHRGTGLACLFDGEPGTGKTLSAEVLAAEAGMRLKRVEAGSVVDKYIGETEKNLARLFAEVNPKRDLLLFDEADALFAKRTEVSRSTDRYSNMEINALLQLVERHDGIVILTTNLKDSIDPAFERRFMFKVRFSMPDAAMRLDLWRRHLPSAAPIEGELDLEELAERYQLAGGAIKNAVLRAAYRAAAADRPLDFELLSQAARHEAVAAGQLVREWRGDDL